VSALEAITGIATQIGAALEPMAGAFRSQPTFATLMEKLGWNIDTVPAALAPLSAPADQVAAAMGDGEVTTEEIPQLLAAIAGFVTALRDVRSRPASDFPAGLDVVAFKAEFPRQLIDFVIVDHLFRRQAGWGELLKLSGVVRLEPVAASASRPAFTRHVLAWEDLGQLLDDPAAVLRNAYDWGQPSFKDEALVWNVADMLDAWHGEYGFAEVGQSILDFLNAGALDPEQIVESALRIPFLTQRTSEFGADIGLQLLTLTQTNAQLPGIAVLPYAEGEAEGEIDLSDDMFAEFTSEADASGGIAIILRPNRPVDLLVGFGAGGAPASSSLSVQASLIWRRDGQEEIVLIGSESGSRVRMGSLRFTVGGRAATGDQPELFVEAHWQRAGIVIKPEAGEADGFLAHLLPSDGATLEFDITTGLSTKQGLYFSGAGGLEISLPAHASLGPIDIQSAVLSIRPTDSAIPISIGVNFAANLGPLKAVVEEVGFTTALTFPTNRDGNLGPLDVALRFKPPKGLGLAIDAGVIKGGGYLRFDADIGEYSGALQLTAGFLSLNAIGIINTRLPGGQTGFSLLVIITAEFDPGFQLGFGFTLLGVGGLLGLNRTVLVQPLAEGVRTGAVNNLLFPRDVVAYAPRIISDTRAIFPPHEGTFLVGPMAKMGWGTPTLISLSLGIVIEIPGNVVILGRLRAALPTEDAAVLVLQVSFIGALEFDKQRVWFFATLYESRVLFITLEGEMGLLMAYGDDPNFVLSVGGFHPRFTAPALPFPTPRRLTLSLINESWARVRAEAYFAVTSNTVQIGCRIEAFFGFDACSVEGYLSFDALLRFSPFYLIVDISAGFDVKVFGVGCFGVHLRGTLEGPTPWIVNGSAEISILFFSFDVDVEVTFGERRAETLPPIAVFPRIQQELAKLESWQATLPASGRFSVSLRNLGAGNVLVLHPVGTLRISQRFAPLNLPLDRVGNQRPSDVNKVAVSVAGDVLEVKGATREKFASAQYRDMDDAAKLSAPSFEPLDSGIELGAKGSPWASGPSAQRTVRYEQIILDTALKPARIKFFEFWGQLFEHFRAGNSVAKSAFSLATQQKLRPFDDTVRVEPPAFTVASQADNKSFAVKVFASFAEADAHAAELMKADPNLVDVIHVIPDTEVNRAA
jgi:hypothetical protein